MLGDEDNDQEEADKADIKYVFFLPPCNISLMFNLFFLNRVFVFGCLGLLLTTISTANFGHCRISSVIPINVITKFTGKLSPQYVYIMLHPRLCVLF